MITNKRLRIVGRGIATAIVAATICFATQAQQSSTTDEKSEETKTGTISGRVVNESGQPVANAAVYVRAVNSPGQGRTTTTDSEGNFQVSGLDRATYYVSGGIPAYVSAPRAADDTQATYYRVGDSVKLELVKGGVITGTVTTPSGEPVVAVRVRSYMIRDSKGQPPSGSIGGYRERTTDDRGVYRIYGLPAGTYLVSAGGGGNSYGFNVDAYDSDTPTYAPSSTRDTAAEINVRAGEEATGVDIRYRGEPGHVVSGIANGPIGPTASSFTIILMSVSNQASQWSNSSFQPPGSRGFGFAGVPDGDYDLTARSALGGGESATSEPRRIKVRGADVTGIELTTKPLGSISGRVALEPSKAPECKGKRRPLFAETLVITQHKEESAAKDKPQSPRFFEVPASPDKDGAFAARNLAPGPHSFNIRFFAKYWYLQSISLLPAAAPAAKAAPANRPVDAARNWTTLRAGDRISGLTITLAEGAASLRGSVKLAEGERVTPQLYLHLVPAEKEKADDVLRFFATTVNADGTFALGNLSPGRYWALAQVVPDNESQWASKLRLPDEAETRAKLRREAEAAKNEIEFKPCQNVTDYQLPLKSH